MTIASNILIAIGGAPRSIVGIEAFSIPLVKNVFMAVERPENEVPGRPPSLLAKEAEPEFGTFGQLYGVIQEQIWRLGPSIFVKTPAPPQVVANYWFPAKLFAITGPHSACKAIDIKGPGAGV